MAKVLVINQGLFQELVNFQEVMETVETAFTQFAQSRSVVFPSVRERIEEHNGIYSIKSSYLIEEGAIGLKTGGFWNDNWKKGKTNHQSVMLLLSPETGEPICLLDANSLTAIRTAAAGAVAAKYLALPESRTVSLIGAGIQARAQLEGLLHLFPLEKVTVYSRTQASAARLVEEIRQKGLQAEQAETPREAVDSSDIVVTTTPAFSPVIKTSWLQKGAHLNAMGSDTSGKREVELDRLPDKIVCDLWEQASHLGELQGQLSRDSLFAEIGQITGKELPGRQTPSEITMFDSTGLAIQDLSVAQFVYRKAMEEQRGIYVDL
ncbi:alanine dehydrogenase [Brevibacillus reuszeri]|uniref:Alanine dehydrogenase n=1 Tax=Brevibacillus reuszeri TaxID=54915 RepID=A0A0K9YQJ3_9BACL|nr:ornithine cyclodeaminase family protein [Brevibacillus reuszeri]KNB70998.1 hypothetical protein ADS79_19435 [Brevibacillus reuszeri]MED1857416.1 ornithine cyclodeaminase family protein [Brevibacillus reuszeri]GED66754.1 alanine dehydrogenase [Brevibacillus reuszeri]